MFFLLIRRRFIYHNQDKNTVISNHELNYVRPKKQQTRFRKYHVCVAKKNIKYQMKRHVTTPMYLLLNSLTDWCTLCVNYNVRPISKHLALSTSYLNEIYLSQTFSFTVKTWVSSFVFNMKAVEEGGRCCCCCWWWRRWRRRCSSLGIVQKTNYLQFYSWTFYGLTVIHCTPFCGKPLGLYDTVAKLFDRN